MKKTSIAIITVLIIILAASSILIWTKIDDRPQLSVLIDVYTETGTYSYYVRHGEKLMVNFELTKLNKIHITVYASPNKFMISPPEKERFYVTVSEKWYLTGSSTQYGDEKFLLVFEEREFSTPPMMFYPPTSGNTYLIWEQTYLPNQLIESGKTQDVPWQSWTQYTLKIIAGGHATGYSDSQTVYRTLDRWVDIYIDLMQTPTKFAIIGITVDNQIP